MHDLTFDMGEAVQNAFAKTDSVKGCPGDCKQSLEKLSKAIGIVFLKRNTQYSSDVLKLITGGLLLRWDYAEVIGVPKEIQVSGLILLPFNSHGLGDH